MNASGLVQDAPFCLQVILENVSFPQESLLSLKMWNTLLAQESLLNLRMWGYTPTTGIPVEPKDVVITPTPTSASSPWYHQQFHQLQVLLRELTIIWNLPFPLWGSALTDTVFPRWSHPQL